MRSFLTSRCSNVAHAVDGQSRTGVAMADVVADIFPDQSNVTCCRAAAIENRHRPVAAYERFEPDFDTVEHCLARTPHAKAILIHRDHLAVRQISRVSATSSQIIAGDERRGEHCPHREVRAVLRRGHPADFEHVGVVPMPRPADRRSPFCLSRICNTPHCDQEP